MAALSKVINIGVIAEDNDDVKVIEEFVGQLVNRSRFKVRWFVGHGCGKIRRKCQAWAGNLVDRGCSALVLVHDLDKADLKTLRAELENKIKDRGSKRLVLIPVEEIEAWLMTDKAAVRAVFGLKSDPSLPSNPENIADPKEYLGGLARKYGGVAYLNTVHNVKLASRTSIKSAAKCPSFRPLPKFVAELFPSERNAISKLMPREKRG